MSLHYQDFPAVNETRDLEYERTQRAFDSRYPEVEGIKCKNYEFCEALLQDWWWELKENYLCTNCEITWGRPLEFREPAECAVCYETLVQVKFPGSCDHWFCCNCTRVLVQGKETSDVSPVLRVRIISTDQERLSFVIYKDYMDALVLRTEPTHRCPMCRTDAIYKNWYE